MYKHQDLQINFPRIESIIDENPRPLWSVMIPTYNNIQYLEKTLKSVIEQAPEPDVMQIEVVDDDSTELDIEEIVSKIGKGRVSFYRQPQNLGFIGN
ncbi:MAG: glycosyltransferase family 2 protein, partial [Sphaerospermopsis kisseleviana]